ncbi:hypothetical protein MRB53_006199 [Persea americana]|uniref:Uncharacterized protein n=1 Tax=Persea americana TaxID=3435 RepID=A0ACC2MGI2_PERAE|nr:hypothetical protein MRB53_006199 [Persea americana]
MGSVRGLDGFCEAFMLQNVKTPCETVINELTAIGHFVYELDQATHILDGLPEEYDPLVVNVAVANLSDNIFVTFVYDLLLNIDMRLTHHRASSSPSDFCPFTTRNGGRKVSSSSCRNGGCPNKGRGRGYQGGHSSF